MAGFVGSFMSCRRSWRRDLDRRRGRSDVLVVSALDVVLDESNVDTRPHVAVVGAGWGGIGAAKALCEAGVRVTLFDTLPDPTGKTPYLTPTGKPFEAGTRGFWKDYPNIENVVTELGLNPNDVFTEFTPSSFFSPDGLEAVAPVFSDSGFPELPSPLGQIVATFNNFKRIPVSDRLTMIGLLYGMLDYTRDEKTFEAYDRMTAHELFIRMGVSKRLVDDFIRPTLLVGLFKPPEELSAAVAMELLYYYALAHQTSFDVRWIKERTIAEKLINPLFQKLIDDYGLDVKGKCRVGNVSISSPSSSSNAVVTSLTYTDYSSTPSGATFTLEDIDACVLAVGSKGMKAIVGQSPKLALRAPVLSRAASLGAIDVVSVRIWLDRYVATDTPANVFSRFESLRGAGGTFFMLDQLQSASEELLWGEDGNPQGSVLACDFYNAGAIATLADGDIVDLLVRELLPAAVPAFAGVQVVDSFVARFMGAVSWFSPGSYRSRPTLEIDGVDNLCCSGDWVRMGDREHGSKGLCQERAYVSGLQAGNALLAKGILKEKASGQELRKEHNVIPIRGDEPQVVLGRRVNRTVMDVLSGIGLDSPWVR